MQRIFATRGLYRDNKSPNYYKTMVIKAIRDTTSRFQPQMQNAPKPMTGNQSGKGGK